MARYGFVTRNHDSPRTPKVRVRSVKKRGEEGKAETANCP